MASPLGGPAANLLVLLKVILLATLVVSAVAVGNVPGLKWSALEVWEGSASGDAWTRSLEYLGTSVRMYSARLATSGTSTCSWTIFRARYGR